jgi:hypothetical protein
VQGRQRAAMTIEDVSTPVETNESLSLFSVDIDAKERKKQSATEQYFN